ncbi:MAG: hypothetical protein PUF66_00565 [Clostridium sp.]|nr:hypothetical protein [Clostridium sp.]
MKSLVVYFSHTGENYMNGAIRNITKGNTEIVDEEISKLTGADNQLMLILITIKTVVM